MHRRLSLGALALTLLLTLGAMASLAPHAEALMLVSRSQEVAVGRQVEAQIIKEYGGLSTDRAVTSRVERIGANVAAMSPRQDVTYTYKVLNSDVINAFAAPGGPVLITKRLAQMLTNDELAFVLAHETGHIAAQHGREAINNALLAQGIYTLFFRRSGDIARTGISVMYTLYNRGYSRSQEYQADSYGAQLMTRAGYNGEGAITALAKLGMKRTTGVNKYFATHPDVPDRIKRIGAALGISEQRQQQLIRQATSG